jgi:hypothetical protein
MARPLMNTETISTLKTVCTAGRASAGFNGDCNDQLEQLVDHGLLDAAGVATAFGPQRLLHTHREGA